mmetsp:Transcript_6454/g.11458  ORF Transcript_6454/g.11458 Transcript_6454/m.11458 type:complete len:473 (-) Transcript_6454:200-1618(-)|eukprot:CAMPEP_0183716314 /NCGR_PEP_ID=MMETSP0737-20130205/10272_1 /TAXON_ID=385413 /ORGANISM="Thalassiosira miniscula, Strain CCMP1093" /LENGTH=472 /DNA_ID=CAMNT_0025945573 /DNA_START=200 /DNA_END=1618 /DNA_ORIENTATION=+
MKYSNISLALAILMANNKNKVAKAADCKKWYSTPCLGDTDIRYDRGYTNNIIEQNPNWSSLQGFWRTKDLSFDNDFKPMVPSVFSLVDTTKSRGIPYTRESFTSFYNFTFDGSRLIKSVANVFPPAPQDFCDNATADMQPDDLLAFPGGTCGETGYVSLGRYFFTSSHEKNGNLGLIGGSTTTLAFKGFFASDEGLSYTVGEDAVYTNEEFSFGGGTVATTTILTFTNKDKTKASSTYDNWNSAFGDTYFLIGSTRSSLEKLSEEEFIDSIQQEFDAQNVPAANRPAIPATCDGGVCPAEDDWCKHDPNCSVSPYQEPEAKLKGGVVGGIVAACAVVVIAASFAYYRWRLAKEEKRVRRVVAVKIAQKLDLSILTNEITAESIQREFKCIDTSGDGLLQKDEVKAFLMQGETVKSKRNLLDDGSEGHITEQEFETIFSILDVDGNGDLSFVEFVTFLNECKNELQKANADQA